MITFTSKVLINGKLYGEGVCTASDDKPTQNIANGSSLIEMDTGHLYMFDAEAGEWRDMT